MFRLRHGIYWAVFTLLLLVQPTVARPAYKQALIDLLGADLPPRLRDCRTCHLPQKPGADEEHDRSHNRFGQRLAALREDFKKAGKKPDITARLRAVLEEDSDGDGVANGLELFAGTWPGEATDKPSGQGLTIARGKLQRWRSQPEGYSWQPFEPVRRPAVPQVGSWARNPIDAFIASEHQRRSLQPRPEATRPVLLRRLYLDLIGLPPTPEEAQAFLADDSPEAYERVVDRLLASPRHGERWGRHWMDVWRYSDWAGFGAEVRDSHKHIWHWRDWIIESLNANKGYDRMVQEMLAGDELAPEDPDTLRATGFLVRNWYLFNRNVWLDRTVEHTAKAFLGVTLNCARCHDHFYDPITQQDYYAFRALFEPHLVRIDKVPQTLDINQAGLSRVYDGQPGTPTYLFVRGDEAQPDKSKPIRPAVPPALGGQLHIQPVALSRLAQQPDRREFVRQQAIAAAEAVIAQSYSAEQRARQLLLATIPPSPPLGLPLSWPLLHYQMGQQYELAALQLQLSQARLAELQAVLAAERLEDAGQENSPQGQQAARQAQQRQRQTAVLVARHAVLTAEFQVWQAPAAKRQPAQMALASARMALQKAQAEQTQPASTSYTRRNLPSYPASSTGRRLALARWITDPQNPLSARVAVNHVWQRHFGKALVASEFDFGRNGQSPSHPELLDWLAAEFIASGWDFKQLHRLIVTSSTYRMDSSASTEQLARDPDNRALWRMNTRRMEAEVVRDSLLALAGRLDLQMGGPDIDHKAGLTVPRRSLYFQHAAEKQMEFLQLFDAANVTECYRRTQSIVPQQALALANSTLAQDMSRLLAGELSARVGHTSASDETFIRQSFERVLGRPPSAQETVVCRGFLQEQAALLADPKQLEPFSGGPTGLVSPARDAQQRARESLIHSLLNLNEFVTIR